MANLRYLSNIVGFTCLTLAGTAGFAGPWHEVPRVPTATSGGYRSVAGAYRGGYRGGFRVSGGASFQVMPRGYMSTSYMGNPWYYGGGRWYRPWQGGYACFYPPVGLGLAILPFGYSTYMYQNTPYYYYEDVYYNSAPSGGYVVVNPPPDRVELGKSTQPAPPSQDPTLDALLIIPKDGQSEEKMVADRQRAQRYAMDESRYDPATCDPSDPGTARARRAYLRALKSFLEDRGYSVK